MTKPKDETKKPAKTESLAMMRRADDTAIQYQRDQVLSDLPPEIREALAEFEVKELVGIAPAWTPKGSVKGDPTKGDDPDFIAGHVISERHGLGQFGSSVLVIESNLGTRSIWLGSDMKLKLGEAPATGRNFVFQFQGWLTKKDNPRIANDMKIIRVIEVMPKKKGD